MVAAHARDDDLPVRLNRNRPSAVVLGAEIGRDPPASAEAHVQPPAGRVADEREVVVIVAIRVDGAAAASGDDLPVFLDRNRIGRAEAVGVEGGQHRSPAPKRGSNFPPAV